MDRRKREREISFSAARGRHPLHHRCMDYRYRRGVTCFSDAYILLIFFLIVLPFTRRRQRPDKLDGNEELAGKRGQLLKSAETNLRPRKSLARGGPECGSCLSRGEDAENNFYPSIASCLSRYDSELRNVAAVKRKITPPRCASMSRRTFGRTWVPPNSQKVAALHRARIT